MYCTCTEISTRTACVSLQQHTFRGHLCAKSSLDVVNKILTVRTVYPDSFPQRVLNVHLKTNIRLTNCKKSSYMSKIKQWEDLELLRDFHFDKDLWPVFVLLISCHQQIASKNRHQAVALCFKVDRSISTQEAAQGLAIKNILNLKLV